MTRFKIVALIIGILLYAGACKKAELMQYKGNADIYFSRAAVEEYVDTLAFSFGYVPISTKDTIVNIQVRIMGAATATDRSFAVGIDTTGATAKEGTHYKLEKCTIPAGQVYGFLPLKLFRTADMATNTLRFTLVLLPNEHFTTAMPYYLPSGKDTMLCTSLGVHVNDILGKPGGWQDYYFGVFSKKKMYLMFEVLQVSPTTLNKYNGALAVPYSITVQRYLNERAAAKDTVFDENGLPMKMSM